MSDVDISPEAVEHTADCLSCLKIYPATRTELPHIRISVDGLMRVASMLRALRAALTATQEKLVAAETAPVRDDAWALRLLEWYWKLVGHDIYGDRVELGYPEPGNYHECLAAFNTQDKPDLFKDTSNE